MFGTLYALLCSLVQPSYEYLCLLLLYLVRSCSIDNPGRSSLFWRGHGEIVLGERGGGGRIGSSGGRGKLCLKCVV